MAVVGGDTKRHDVSVVVSSYNRDDKVFETLEHLLAVDTSGFESVELIVIDDGSPRPVADVISRLKSVPPIFRLRSIRQENAGIGATRNRGFREAESDLVLFLDDDILVEKSVLLTAARMSEKDGIGIIFGSCPFASYETRSLEKFATELYGYGNIAVEEGYEPVDALASALLVVNKAKLRGIESLYHDDLMTPAAEEHEAISRFHRMGVPIYLAKNFTAIHNHHLELTWLAEQQYKYGIATAEAFEKLPEISEMEKFDRLKNKLEQLTGVDPKSIVKRAVASYPGRKIIFLLSKAVQRISPDGDHNYIYGLLTTAFFWGGYLEGRRRFVNQH